MRVKSARRLPKKNPRIVHGIIGALVVGIIVGLLIGAVLHFYFRVGDIILRGL